MLVRKNSDISDRSLGRPESSTEWEELDQGGSMTDYEGGRYEENGEDLDSYRGGGSSPALRGNSHGGHDDNSDSKSQVSCCLPL